MLFLLHIVLMVIATLGIMAGVSAAMFFRKKKNWLKIHKTLNTLSLAGITAGIIMAFFYVAGTGGKHLNDVHQMTGLAAFTVVLIAIALGHYQFKALNKSAIRAAHRWMGRVSIFILAAAVLLGLRLINLL